MYVCSCFGITEQQVREHADTGACTPRQIAGACKAGTDCGSCVRKIQALLGRGGCPRREAPDPVVLTTATTTAATATAVTAASVTAAAEAA
ncbi:(2Fe-2S)-binding protein [Streptomyces antioxidans]|uniref:Bacterioferritin-associated ferredoxin n=1 Tax=Streptomyces antioxidans TaxID=1507734 RepID=A0A1V4D4A5_9ACTN|nr:(2Fe-2S)-binding protein [Streptomyces antioxidans]OPF79073.1 (2Fe-2S)-binding protein [Streptomyces antioxidans]